MISASSPGSSGVPESNRKVLEVDRSMENDKQGVVIESKEEISRKEIESNEEILKKGIESKEEVSSKGVESKEVTPKWVSVAQERRCLKKYDVEVKAVDGKQKVEIPVNLLVDATPLWEDFIFGKFLDISPHIAKVHMVVNKIWSYGDPNSKVEVYDVNATMMRFRIMNPKIREKVIKRGMWNIAGVPMIVKKWTPKTEEEKQEEVSIPMWVHLRKVPLHMFSWEALSFMTSTVGSPVHLHPETLACSNFDEAKVFVNVDVSKTLPKEIEFTIDGKEFTAEFYYPWLPSRCSLCEKWGHNDKVCVMNKKEKIQGELGSGIKGGSKVIRDQNIQGVDVVKEKNMGSSSAKKSYEVNVSEMKGGEQDIIVKSGGKNEEDWALVSPDKVGRSSSLVQKQVVEISASKFAVLSLEVQEEGEIIVEEAKEDDNEYMEEEEANDIREEDLIEDELLEQNEKVVEQKGGKRVQKTRTQGVNPRGKRSSRRKT